MKAFFARALLCAFPCVAMAQVAVLEIKVVEGEGAVHPVGAHIARPLTVEVTDENGRPVAGAAVSFQLPPDGPGGMFSNGLRTDLVITGTDGRASLHGLQLNRTSGPFRIRITAGKEQARAGIVSQQYIGGNAGSDTRTTSAAATSTPTTTATAKNEPQPPSGQTVKSGEITPTTTKMGSGSHKKWIVIAALVAGGAIAFVGVSRASKSNGGGGGTVSSSTVSIGTPIITIGNP